MSWSLSVSTTTPATLEADLAEARHAAIEANQFQGCLDEAIAAADVAIPAVVQLVQAIVPAGATDTPLSVSLNGHANPGNVPNAEWANDFITVTVNNKTPKS